MWNLRLVDWKKCKVQLANIMIIFLDISWEFWINTVNYFWMMIKTKPKMFRPQQKYSNN